MGEVSALLEVPLEAVLEGMGLLGEVELVLLQEATKDLNQEDVQFPEVLKKLIHFIMEYSR
jgi:hypothetical protein